MLHLFHQAIQTIIDLEEPQIKITNYQEICAKVIFNQNYYIKKLKL